ncbi:invasion associated locus B family protein [Bradyrhizobium sp. USDA 4473]
MIDKPKLWAAALAASTQASRQTALATAQVRSRYAWRYARVLCVGLAIVGAYLPLNAGADGDAGNMLFYLLPWAKFCLTGKDAKRICFTGKDARIESGQPVLAAVLIEPDSDPKKIFRVTLPLGMQFAQGTRIIIDNGTPLQRPFVTCLANGCVSDYDATPELIAALKDGKELVVQAINGDSHPVSLPLPLAGFAAAADGIPTDSKIFEAEQKRTQEDFKRNPNAYESRSLKAVAQGDDAASAPAKPTSAASRECQRDGSYTRQKIRTTCAITCAGLQGLRGVGLYRVCMGARDATDDYCYTMVTDMCTQECERDGSIGNRRFCNGQAY